MISQKTKKALAGILLALSIFGIGGFTSNFIKQQKEAKQYTNTIVVDDIKVLEEKAVVESVQELGNLEILKLNVNKNIKIKEGKVFKKEQQIKFKSECIFKIDLTELTKDSVIINENEIKIFIAEPTLDVSFLEDKTEFGEVETKWYDLGNKIDMTMEEMEDIKTKLKDEIYVSAMAELETAKEKTASTIEGVLLNLTKENYKVNVIFIK